MAAHLVESDDDFDYSDDENQKSFALSNKNKTIHQQTLDHNSSDEDSDNEFQNNTDDDEDFASEKTNPKSKKSFFDKSEESSDEEDDNEDNKHQTATKVTADSSKSNLDAIADDNDDDDDQYFGYLSGEEKEDGSFRIEEENDSSTDKKISPKKTKVKKLTAKQLEKEEKKIKRSGVVYLSSLPPYMKPQKLRHIMTRFGEVGRIFLKPEDPKVYKSRIKSGGNKKKKFEEGWIEFASKTHAKLAAETLNGNILGGKKRGFYHDDVMNVKYLKGFKWFDLTDALNREVEVRESKKQAELSQAHKINKAFIKNVETSKTINRVKESKKRKIDDNDDNDEKLEIRRNYKQRNVVTHRADANESIKSKSEGLQINNVLNKIF